MNTEDLHSVTTRMLALCIHSLRAKIRLARDPRLGTEDPIASDLMDL